MEIEGKWLIGGPDSPDQGTYEGKTEAQWRELAAACSARSRASFERSDTDGFLSQWASDMTARKHLMCADLARDGGIREFPAPFDLEGNLINALFIKTQYGWTWLLRTVPHWWKGKPFLNPSRALKGAVRRRNDSAKGIAMGTVRTRAEVRTGGSGKGMSGAVGMHYFVSRVPDSPVEIVDNGSLGTQYQDE